MVGQKILIIDDDLGLLQLVSVIFKKVGASVITAQDGLDGITKFFTYRPDLVILDVLMPGNDGLDICQRIRQVSDAPLILLTALNGEQDMLKGFAAGADDFLTKPFNPEILLARARTVLRRAQYSNGHNGNNGDSGSSDSFSYNDGNLSIDIESHDVLRRGKRIKLTPIEFRLLVYLVRNGGKLLTLERILSNVWGNEYEGSIELVHVYISHLRRKLEENPKHPCYIQTIHGIGYIFDKKEIGYES